MDNDFLDTPLTDTELRALDRLAYYLGQRDHSKKELQEKLSRKFQPETIARVLEEAQARRWLLDPADLALKVSEALHRKGKGIIYINRYLQKKGLPPVERSLELETEKACKHLALKFSGIKKFSFEQRSKAYKYLVYRGYDDETIKKAIHEFETDSLDLY